MIAYSVFRVAVQSDTRRTQHEIRSMSLVPHFYPSPQDMPRKKINFSSLPAIIQGGMSIGVSCLRASGRPENITPTTLN
jgi:hypothetical protein